MSIITALKLPKFVPLTKTARILKTLQVNGSATNRQLNRICYRYGARIHDLRKEGHIITSVHERDGLWLFIYKGHRDDSKEDAHVS